MDTFQFRSCAKVLRAQHISDGAGVKLSRSLGSMMLPDLDPFLLLDEFHSSNPEDYIAGFPSHPHRGFETVTYMLEGQMEHRDSHGHIGRLSAGGVQWMTAGRGIIHSEMPIQEQGLLRGFQLWVNLPRAKKMCEPKYQDISPDKIPVIEGPGHELRLIAGESEGQEGPVNGISVDPIFIDCRLDSYSGFDHQLPAGHRAFIYVYDGRGKFGGPHREHGTPLIREHFAALSNGSILRVWTDQNPVRYLLVAGQPILEPVVRQGPFVMNTHGEIKQAILDYQNGTLA